uniref:Uncharacterized protein n=1 Tax=Lepeophtheirus salmonis TaxID=72036 RepID=A0A0K2U6S8_LEPSM
MEGGRNSFLLLFFVVRQGSSSCGASAHRQ